MNVKCENLRRTQSKIDVCHLTSAHDRADTRIFHKLCMSLQKHGYNVALIVADGKLDEDMSGVRIIGVEKQSSRVLRMLVTPFRVFSRARKMHAKIFHFHDPELLLIGWLLRVFCGAQVVYDAHEDLRKTILAKTYIPKRFRLFVAVISDIVEKSMAARLNAVVAATPHIKSNFDMYNQRSISVCNYPLMEVRSKPSRRSESSPKRVAYVGNLGVNRGVFEMVSALELCHNHICLDVCGSFLEKNTERSVMEQPGWANVKFHGWVGVSEIGDILSRSSAGIVTLKATPNYLYSLPVKMFEYMQAGIPVIASDFPEWRPIIQKYECGILVNPEDPRSIAKAIDFIIDNPNLAKKMGKNGKKAIAQKFNWAMEEQKLFSLYEQLIKDFACPS